MKKFICCLSFVLLALQLAAQGDVSQAAWQPVKIVTDGDNGEWPKPLNLYDAVTGLLFTVANDSTNLYLCFTGNDERKLTKLMKAGWNINIFSKEKNKKFDATIEFPAVQMIPAPGKDGGITQNELPGFKNETALYRLNLQAVKTKGFLSANGDIPLLNTHGINIGVGSDSTREIIFELSIPLKELLPENNLQLNEQMVMDITVHALKKPARHASKDGGASFNAGKGNRKAINDAYPVDRSLLFTEIDFKQKFRLANK